MPVDFTASLGPLLELLGAALVAVATYGVYYLSRWAKTKYGFEIDDEARANINTALENGIFWATNKVNQELGDELDDVIIKNAMVAAMAQYVSDRVPDSLESFGITEEGVKQLVESRLEAIWGAAEIEGPAIEIE